MCDYHSISLIKNVKCGAAKQDHRQAAIKKTDTYIKVVMNKLYTGSNYGG